MCIYTVKKQKNLKKIPRVGCVTLPNVPKLDL